MNKNFIILFLLLIILNLNDLLISYYVLKSNIGLTEINMIPKIIYSILNFLGLILVKIIGLVIIFVLLYLLYRLKSDYAYLLLFCLNLLYCFILLYNLIILNLTLK
jgi:hypothetical protein